MSQTFNVDVDALDLFDQVAAMARVDPGKVYRGFLRLWQYCWRAKVDRVTRERLGGFFPVEDLGTLIQAAISCEFLSDERGTHTEGHPAGLLVRGAEKRLGIYKARQKAGRLNAGNLVQFRRVPPGEPPGDPVSDPAGDPEQNTGSLPNHPFTHLEEEGISPEQEAEASFPEADGSLPESRAEPLLVPVDSDEGSPVARVLKHYVAAMKASRVEVRDTPDKRKLIKRQLDAKWKPEQLMDAIDGLTWSDWHMGRDPKTKGKRYCALEYAIGKNEAIERWLNEQKARSAS